MYLDANSDCRADVTAMNRIGIENEKSLVPTGTWGRPISRLEVVVAAVATRGICSHFFTAAEARREDKLVEECVAWT